jgi:hypothetical protein
MKSSWINWPSVIRNIKIKGNSLVIFPRVGKKLGRRTITNLKQNQKRVTQGITGYGNSPFLTALTL